MNRPILTDLNPDEYNQGLCCYLFMVNLDRSNTSCNILGDKSCRLCVSNQTKDANLSVFNIITRINESRTLIKHISLNVNVNLKVESVIQIKS